MLTSILLGLSAFSGQEIVNQDIFGPDVSMAKKIENVSTITCARDVASMNYRSAPGGGDRIIRATVNRRNVSKADIDAANAVIGAGKIEKIDWRRCPVGGAAGNTIRLYVQLASASGKRFLVLNLGRNGRLTRE